MTKHFIAGLLAATVALTGLSTAPARAMDSGEFGRLVLGIGALAIIGSAVANSNRNGTVTRRVVPDQDYPVRRHYKVLPGQCLRENDFNGGPRLFFGKRCLRENMRNYSALPNQCLTNVWTYNGSRTVYSARCLQRNGWQII